MLCNSSFEDWISSLADCSSSLAASCCSTSDCMYSRVTDNSSCNRIKIRPGGTEKLQYLHFSFDDAPGGSVTREENPVSFFLGVMLGAKLLIQEARFLARAHGFSGGARRGGMKL